MLRKIIKTKKGKWALALIVISVIAAFGSTKAVPGAAILLAVGILLAITASKEITPTSKVRSDKKTAEEPELKINIQTSSSEYYVDRLLADGETLSLVNLDGYVSPSGGFVNWATFAVTGKNTSTNRKNKRQYDAKTEAEAIMQAEADGLTGPFEISVITHDAPTERQIQYLQSWGASVPDGANRTDISTILSRLENETETISEKMLSVSTREERVRLLPSPAPDFARFADSMGVRFSRFVGKSALFDNTLYHLTGRDRIAFYAYCIICSHHKSEIGDMRNSEYISRLYEFADVVAYDSSLLRSIEGRSANDYLHPHKGSTAYKAVAKFFDLK